MSLSQVLDAFTKNAVLYLIIVAVLAGLSIWMGLTTIGAFLVMVLGMMMILWDAHTDPHIPEAPTLT
jgi:Na+/alanine symporter